MTDQTTELTNLIKQSHHIVALTGAGISASAGIPTLEQINHYGRFNTNFSESELTNEPEKFYSELHSSFIDPILHHGPTLAHNVLAQLEAANHLKGIVTTNVDYLHERAGNKHVADIWSSFNVNHCLNCGRVYPLSILDQPVPRCPECGGLLEPDPQFRHIATLPDQVAKADSWMESADLVIVVGCNGYYSNVGQHSIVIDINPKQTMFDRQAQLVIRESADEAFAKLADAMHLKTTSV